MALSRLHRLLKKSRPLSRSAQQRKMTLETLEDRMVLSFLPPVTFPVGVLPRAVTVADFNADFRGRKFTHTETDARSFLYTRERRYNSVQPRKKQRSRSVPSPWEASSWRVGVTMGVGEFLPQGPGQIAFILVDRYRTEQGVNAVNSGK